MVDKSQILGWETMQKVNSNKNGVLTRKYLVYIKVWIS